MISMLKFPLNENEKMVIKLHPTFLKKKVIKMCKPIYGASSIKLEKDKLWKK